MAASPALPSGPASESARSATLRRTASLLRLVVALIANFLTAASESSRSVDNTWSETAAGNLSASASNAMDWLVDTTAPLVTVNDVALAVISGALLRYLGGSLTRDALLKLAKRARVHGVSVLTPLQWNVAWQDHTTARHEAASA